MTLVLCGAMVWLALAAYFKPVPGTSESDRGVVSLWVALLSSVGALVVLSRGIVRSLSGEPWLLPLSVLGLVFLFPFATCRLVTMPLGLLRTTYALSFLCLVRFNEDPRGAAALLGALTLLRARQVEGPTEMPAEERDRRFLEDRLARMKTLGGAGLVAQALLTARRGDLEGARALLATLSTLDPRVYPPWAAAIACDYLAVDALARGDFAALHRQVADARVLPPLSRLIAAGAPAPAPTGATSPASPASPADPDRPTEAAPRPGRAALWLLYLRASHLVQAWPLLQRALQKPRRPPAPSEEAAQAASPAADLPRALAALVRLLAAEAPRLTVADFRRVGGALEQALCDPQTQRRVLERALALGLSAAGPGGVSGDTALAALRTEASQALAGRLRQSGLPLGPLDDADPASTARPTVLGAAVAVLRGELISALEDACTALRSRTLDKRELPRLDEWREWATLRAMYQQVGERGGLGARRLGWTAFHRDACNWAVWLWNVRGEKILANTVFRFLLAEAEALDDDRSAALAKKNIACGI